MDNLTPQERSRQMSLVKSRDTKPEWLVRRIVFAMGHLTPLFREGRTSCFEGGERPSSCTVVSGTNTVAQWAGVFQSRECNSGGRSLIRTNFGIEGIGAPSGNSDGRCSWFGSASSETKRR